VPLELSAESFDELVTEELDALSDEIVERLDNVIFVVEDISPENDMGLLGVYDGIALTERSQYGFGELPDRIVLFRLPLLNACATVEELREQVHITLVHEIAHFYGLTDEELDELGWA
jgi:predicted Zn-dependent protease with MMP-like domain